MHLKPRIGATLLAIGLLATSASEIAAGQGHGLDQVATPAAGAGWTVTDARVVDVSGTPVTLSPDGTLLAGIGEDSTLCLWDAATFEERACDATELPIWADSITWAPDGSAVAFSLDAFQRLYESDIYVFEIETGAIVNLTDDGVDGTFMRVDDEVVPVDVMPAWRADSISLVFVRTPWGPESSSTELMTIDRAGGEPKSLYVVAPDSPFAIYTTIFPLEDGSLLYSYLPVDRDDPDTGIWRLDGEAEQVHPGDAAFAQPIISDVFAQDGSVLVAGFSGGAYTSFDLDAPVSFVLDLASGRVTSLDAPDQPTSAMGPSAFSPDGGTLIAIALGPDGDELVFAGATSTTVPLEAEQVVDVSGFAFYRGPDWVANDTVFVPAGLATQPYVLTMAPAGAPSAT